VDTPLWQIGCDDDALAFVALTEGLEEQIGAMLADRQVTQFVQLCGAPHNWTNVKHLVMWSPHADSK